MWWPYYLGGVMKNMELTLKYGGGFRVRPLLGPLYLLSTFSADGKTTHRLKLRLRRSMRRSS